MKLENRQAQIEILEASLAQRKMELQKTSRQLVKARTDQILNQNQLCVRNQYRYKNQMDLVFWFSSGFCTEIWFWFFI